MNMGSTSFLAALGPAPVYENVFALTQWILTHITPFLIVIAVYIRIIETQLDAYSGQSRYLLAVKDFLFFGALCSMYFAMGNLIAWGFNSLYAVFHTVGSYDLVNQQMSGFMEQVGKMDRGSGVADTAKEWSINIITAPAKAVAFSIYYITFLLASFTQTFMQLALALGFGFAFAWGAIAIPLAMTINFKLLKGWGVFFGGILLWPIIEAMFMGLLAPVFANATQNFIDGGGLSSVADAADVYTLYSILNLIIVVIHIVVPLVAGAIASNSSAMNSLVMPFAAGAIAAAGATYKGSKMGGKMATTAATNAPAAIAGGAQLATKGVEAISNAMRGPAQVNPYDFGKGTGVSAATSSPSQPTTSNVSSGDTLKKSGGLYGSPPAAPAAGYDTLTSNDGGLMKSTTAKAVAATSFSDSGGALTPSSSDGVAAQHASDSSTQSQGEKGKKPRIRTSEDSRRGHFINKAAGKS